MPLALLRRVTAAFVFSSPCLCDRGSYGPLMRWCAPLLMLNDGTLLLTKFMRHCPSSSEFVSTHGSWEVGKTHVDVDLWLLGKDVCYSVPSSYPPDSPNVSFTYSSLCETSSVEVPLWIGGNPALPLYFYSRCPSCPPVPFSSHQALLCRVSLMIRALGV